MVASHNYIHICISHITAFMIYMVYNKLFIIIVDLILFYTIAIAIHGQHSEREALGAKPSSF